MLKVRTLRQPPRTVGSRYIPAYYHTELVYIGPRGGVVRFWRSGSRGIREPFTETVEEVLARFEEHWFATAFEENAVEIPDWLDGEGISCGRPDRVPLPLLYINNSLERVQKYIKFLHGLGPIFDGDSRFLVDALVGGREITVGVFDGRQYHPTR